MKALSTLLLICAFFFSNAQDSLKIQLIDEYGKPIEIMVNLYLEKGGVQYETTTINGRANFEIQTQDTFVLTAQNMGHTFFKDTLTLSNDTVIMRTVDPEFVLELDVVEVLETKPLIQVRYGCGRYFFWNEFENAIIPGLHFTNGASPTLINLLGTRD
jgi:hypothetical protein